MHIPLTRSHIRPFVVLDKNRLNDNPVNRKRLLFSHAILYLQVEISSSSGIKEFMLRRGRVRLQTNRVPEKTTARSSGKWEMLGGGGGGWLVEFRVQKKPQRSCVKILPFLLSLKCSLYLLNKCF